MLQEPLKINGPFLKLLELNDGLLLRRSRVQILAKERTINSEQKVIFIFNFTCDTVYSIHVQGQVQVEHTWWLNFFASCFKSLEKYELKLCHKKFTNTNLADKI